MLNKCLYLLNTDLAMQNKEIKRYLLDANNVPKIIL